MKDLKRDQELRDKALKLFRIFFFGEDMSPLEMMIEHRYLLEKQHKYLTYLRSGVNYFDYFRKRDSKWFGLKAIKGDFKI